MALEDRNFFRFPIDRAGRTEDDVLYFRFVHCLQQRNSSGHVVSIIPKRFGRRFADRFQGGEMNDGGDVGMIPKYPIQQVAIK